MRNSSVDVKRYTGARQAQWDTFVSRAKNRHFIFLRGFTEYHSDRFEDHSLMFFEDDALVGVLPANRSGDVLHSHQGLTFGTVVSGPEMSAGLMLRVFAALRAYMRSHGLSKAIVKPLPHVFHGIPAEEDLYALTAHGARLVRRDLSSVLDLHAGPHYTKGKKSNVSRARRYGVAVRQTQDVAAFAELLCAVLKSRHGVAPAHSEAEIRLLCERFPQHVKVVGAFVADKMMAASLLFDNGSVVHTQYLANGPEGRDMGALDMLVHMLITSAGPDCRYLSFGISTEQAGTVVNHGLLESKEAFGARGVTHDWYEMTQD